MTSPIPARPASGARALQRALGAAALTVHAAHHGTALWLLREAGCLKLRFPRNPGGGLEAVLINTAGGVADGDALSVDLAVEENAALTLSTPGCERIYRARNGAAPARIAVRARVEEGARLDYLPQETLLFDGCALIRGLTVDMHPGAHFLAVEALLLGRRHSGETLRTVSLRDTLCIRRGGALLLQDTLRLQGDTAPWLASRAGFGGAGGVATVICVAPDAAARLPLLRAALAGADAGCSAQRGLLVARLTAPDGLALRRLLLAAIGVLRENPLPRLWAC